MKSQEIAMPVYLTHKPLVHTIERVNICILNFNSSSCKLIFGQRRGLLPSIISKIKWHSRTSDLNSVSDWGWVNANEPVHKAQHWAPLLLLPLSWLHQ